MVPCRASARPRTEQDPLDWWRATVTAVRQAAGPDVVAIGFFGQMHGCLMPVTWTSEQIMAGVSVVRPFYLLFLKYS